MAALKENTGERVAVFATRGALESGFYQRELQEHDIPFVVPDAGDAQTAVDDCIRHVKRGEVAAGAISLACAFDHARKQGATKVIMGCTEIPIAAPFVEAGGLQLIDSSLELARATVAFALERGWNKPKWDC